MSQARGKIGLLDHMGGGNLGDDTTQTAVMQSLRSRWPEALIYGFSMNPVDTTLRHAIPAFPIRRETWWVPNVNPEDGSILPGTTDQPHRRNIVLRQLRALCRAVLKRPMVVAAELVFLFRSFRIVRTLDVFVINGGGQLLDSWGGPWDYPYTLFKWAWLARLSGTKLYFVSVGAGPIKHSLSKFFIRHALSLAAYVSFRDCDSKNLSREIGFHGEAGVFPDCVYALDVPSRDAGADDARNLPLVGLSPMAYCDPRRYWLRDQDAYDAFTAKLVRFGSWVSSDHGLTLFSTDMWFDAETIEEVDTALRSEAGMDATHLLPHAPILEIDTLLSCMSSMDYIITCRFHGVVFAHLMNIPVIALSHHPKVATLMSDLGLSEYCLNIDTFDVELLIATFNRMVANKTAIKARMAEKATLYRNELTNQFDQLFSPEVR